MRIKYFILVLLGIWFAVGGLQAQNLKNRLDSMSYALGLDLGRNLDKLDMNLNSEMVYKGMTDVLNEQTVLLTDNDLRKWLNVFQQEAQAASQRAQAAQFEEIRVEGENFLAENKTKEGIQVTASGLQYEILKQGSGAKPPSPSTTVVVHYEGKLLDGSIFDSSYQRGEPTEFPLNRVISGWTEGLQLMNEGSKYRFYIPYNLAYGQRGSQPKIPPYSALIFDVELIQIK